MEAASFQTRRAFLRLTGSGVAAACLGGTYAFGIEPVWLRTVERDLELPGLDPSLDGYTIAQLSDLHVGSGVPAGLLREAVRTVNAAEPDAIALTGDFVHRGSRRGLAERAGELLAPLQARDGVFAVLGNHDAQVYGRRRHVDADAMRRITGALTEAGAKVLENERVRIKPGLDIVGFGDLWCGTFMPGSVKREVTTVALSHNPDTAPQLARRGHDLILSGHTHGGQVWLPGVGAPILPVEHREFVGGHYRLGESQLYINRGLGWLRRVRLFTRPEVTVLRLRPV